MSTNWIKVGVAAVCFTTGVALSHRIEPGVRVENVTLTHETPAIKFIPAGPGPHPVALLAHGYAASKETLFLYGEALAAAGFICYSVDQPGHGASPRKFTFMEAVQTLEAVAREVGPVDVFAGSSMGGFTGGEAVREGEIRPQLFIAIGSMPVLGDHAPPLLFLAGRFEEAFPPALLKTRTDARLVISPWSDHVLEQWDPVLVSAAVEAACATVHKTPPAPPTAWIWRLIGAALAMLAAGALASYLADLLPRLARFRGLLIGGFVAGAFMLTMCGKWVDAKPNLLPLGIAIPLAILLVIISGRLRIPRWSYAVLSLLVMVIAAFCFDPSQSWPAFIVLVGTIVLTPVLIVGILLGWVAARRGSRLQGDIAMAIFVACLAVQGIGRVRTAPQASTPHIAIKLDEKLLDACVGEYEMAPDNVYGAGAKVTVRRKGDHLVWRAFRGPMDLYPESETKFFFKEYEAQVTFIKDEQGEVIAISRHKPGVPDSEGKKLKDD
jgi:alpha-beta hydrolase superfamily lysophospholipase